MPTLLCTGSGGFIISNFVRQAIYNKFGYNLVSIDKVQKNKALANYYVNKNHTFYIGDVSDAHFVNVIFEIEKPDIVLHGSALTHVDNSITDACSFVQNNVMGTQVIIDACVKWRIKKLVMLSTDEVYGHLTNENDPSWTEQSPTNPRNPYSASKLSGELLVKAASETHGLKYNITRSCNNYGPRQTSDKLIPKIIKNILNETKVPIYGKGTNVRDWIHVNDNCDALMKIITDGKENEIYNISAGQEFSNVEVFQEVCNSLGKGHDLIEFVNDRKGHDFRYSTDSSKLKELGWKPEVKFKDGIKSVCEWYSKNRHSYLK